MGFFTWENIQREREREKEKGLRGEVGKKERRAVMGSEAKTNGGIGGGGGGFRSRMEHYLYSGEKKHVCGGILIISVIFGIPWYFMNRGTLSLRLPHQDM